MEKKNELNMVKTQQTAYNAQTRLEFQAFFFISKLIALKVPKKAPRAYTMYTRPKKGGNCKLNLLTCHAIKLT